MKRTIRRLLAGCLLFGVTGGIADCNKDTTTNVIIDPDPTPTPTPEPTPEPTCLPVGAPCVDSLACCGRNCSPVSAGSVARECK